MRTFHDIINDFDLNALRHQIHAAKRTDVERVLRQDRIDDSDLFTLFSEAAAHHIEAIAQRSAATTERRFGRIITLYTPLYLSNECVNQCPYCGFSRKVDIPRVTLTPDEALSEAGLLSSQGFRHILLVSGEDRVRVNESYLIEIISKLRRSFDSISIEIYPMSADEYRRLSDAGVDGLALYQETYDPERYNQLHTHGPKSSYTNRLQAIENGGEAGFRSLGIGALLGIADWRLEAVMLALHGRYLARRFWRSRISVSFPRIRAAAGSYQPEFPVSDGDLVLMMCALRLILPDADLVLSTREPAKLRDSLVGLGITRMSAGSRTSPGGYAKIDSAGEQFHVEDPRTPAEVATMIESKGFEPVWKDFDRELSAPW